MTMVSIQTNLKRVHERIQRACAACDRDVSTVRLLAVSKTKPWELVRQAIEAGQRDFGENYLQDALLKIAASGEYRPIWHYIGAIQSNKTRDIAERFDWIHTVASEKIARRLNDQRPPDLPRLNALIQVNINDEAGKAGVTESALPTLIERMLPCQRIRLCGLMAIPEQTTDTARQRENFARLADLGRAMATRFGLVEFSELSMGMSDDLEAAIAEGATWVRIGTAIFGVRQ